MLRRYRDGANARGEAALMAELAAAGYPVPGVHADAAPAFTDLVLERIDGPTLLAADPGLDDGERAMIGEALALVTGLRWPRATGRVAADLASMLSSNLRPKLKFTSE
ncbi:hypothetical protein [Streptomyces sp. PT12]|uniref:hypothetical protein n=1 Tax=Streptomyces sp. PT12 TaxID=1510197 RepID=UPI0026B4D5F2